MKSKIKLTTLSDFVQSYHFASYGSDGQYQFNETRRSIANKLDHWRNNR